MPFATPDKSSVSVIKETSPGVLPDPVNMTTIPFTGFSPNLSRPPIESGEVTGNRQENKPRSGNEENRLTLNTNLQVHSYDILLEALMYTPYLSDVLKVGQFQQTVAIEQTHPDVPLHTLYRGCRVDSMSISSKIDGATTCTFELLAQYADAPKSFTSSDAKAAVTNPALLHFDGNATFNGSPAENLTGIDLTVQNQLNSNYVWGTKEPASISSRGVKISGSISAYYDSATYANHYINETTAQLLFSFTDINGATLTFTVPSLVFQSASSTIQIGDSLFEYTYPFSAFYNAGVNTALIIARSTP